VITPERVARPWKLGDRVLLFLKADADVPHPSHVVVAHMMANARYFLDGDRLAAADSAPANFTLDAVRRAGRSSLRFSVGAQRAERPAPPLRRVKAPPQRTRAVNCQSIHHRPRLHIVKMDHSKPGRLRSTAP